MTDLIQRAKAFAIHAHRDHKRKYTGVPYHTHLEEVANIVASVTSDEEMIAAAWLHDTVEDTATTIGDIEAAFGSTVAHLVWHLTDVSKPSDGNRAARKAIDREHLSHAHPDAKTIKLADLISNSADIVVNDPKFAKVYLGEKYLLLPFLKEGDPTLFKTASDQVDLYSKKLVYDLRGSDQARLGNPRGLT